MSAPAWMSQKQVEGARLLHAELNYLKDAAEVIYSQAERDDCHDFMVVIQWGSSACPDTELWIAWNYQQVWDRCGEEINQWQIVIDSDDSTIELTEAHIYLMLLQDLQATCNSLVAQNSKLKRGAA